MGQTTCGADMSQRSADGRLPRTGPPRCARPQLRLDAAAAQARIATETDHATIASMLSSAGLAFDPSADWGVVVDRGTLVGAACLATAAGADDQPAAVATCVVAPDHRDLGHGRRLVRWLQARAAANGQALLTATASPALASFFERVGFTPSGDQGDLITLTIPTGQPGNLA